MAARTHIAMDMLMSMPSPDRGPVPVLGWVIAA
jgi:hypothetical protein